MKGHLLAWMVASPAIAATLLLLIPGRMRQAIRWVSLAGASGGLVGAVVAALSWDKGTGGFQMAERYPLVPSMGISLSLAADGMEHRARAPHRQSSSSPACWRAGRCSAGTRSSSSSCSPW